MLQLLASKTLVGYAALILGQLGLAKAGVDVPWEVVSLFGLGIAGKEAAGKFTRKRQ